MEYRVRPALKAAYESLKDKPVPLIIVQVIDTSKNTAECFIPLESVEDFIDAQYLTPNELEGKLARKKFDSDEESSESEPEASDNEDVESDEE